MKKAITFIVVALILMPMFYFFFFTSQIGTPPPIDRCSVPPLDAMVISTSTIFETNLIAEAKAQLPKLQQKDANANVETAIKKIFQYSGKTEVSQEFYQWYQSTRLRICTLMDFIETTENSLNPDFDLIRKSRRDLLNLILGYEDWNKKVDINTINDFQDEINELQKRLDYTIYDVETQLATLFMQISKTDKVQIKDKLSEKYFRLQADLLAIKQLRDKSLPEAIRSNNISYELDKVKKALNQTIKNIG